MAKQQLPQQSENDGLPKISSEVNLEEPKSNDLSNSRSILAEILTMPEASTVRQRFKYNKDQLVAISQTTGAKIRPHFLQLEFFNDSGVWDPEKWVLSERNDDVQKSNLDEPKSKRERSIDLDKENTASKRKSADPKERLKEEQDGIILSPQRRSFGTGCHVTQQLTGASRRSESPPDIRSNDRDNHREPTRRIGSGRFFTREREREREREYGYRSNDRSREFDRETGRERGRNDRDRFRRDERDRDVRSNRDMPIKERDFERRGVKEKGFRRIEEEEEPEWFSGGPTSQSETIELRGFDDSNEDEERRGKDGAKRERRKSWRKPKSPAIEDIAERSEDCSEPLEKKNQNGIEANKTASAGETSRSDGNSEEQPPTSSGFDFGDLFKFENATIFPSHATLSPENLDSALSGSRFGQFFRREPSPAQNNSTDTSRRSSFQDELIAPIIGTLSEHGDLASSPTSGSDTYFAPISPAQLTKSSSESKQLLDMLQSNCDDMFLNNSESTSLLSNPDATKDLQKLETDLKNLVLGNVNSNNHNGNQVENDGSFQGPSNGNMNAFEKLLSQISDGRVTPAASHRLSLNNFDSDHKKSVQSDFHLPPSTKLHMMDVLKHAPTEQDILNGFHNENSSSTRPLASTSVQKPNDFMSLFGVQSQGSDPASSIDSVLMKSINKSSSLHQGHPSQNQSFFYSGIDNLQKPSAPVQVNAGLKNNLRTSSVTSQQPPANSIQQQQREILAAILKQQQQQQQQVGPPRQPSPIQPPAIQHHCGSPNPHLTNGPVSPRSMSPSHHDCNNVHSFLQHQQRPTIPSPLMFRQDPPSISHAPSPIHPTQMVQTMAPASPLNPNTLQVQAGHILARVPSPQELRAHTQQIMQNALIKKKLEEQKENFRKRQEMKESQSSNVNKFADNGTSLKTSSGLSPSLSIIPTSVMRKMQVGKEKDVGKISSVSSNQQQNALQSLVHLAGSDGKVRNQAVSSPSTGILFSNDLEKMQKQNQIQQRPVLGQSFSNGPVIGRGSSVNLSTTTATSASNSLPLQGRRIVKSSQPGQQNQQRVMTNSTQLLGNHNKAYLPGPGNLDLTKQLLLQQQAAAAAQRQLNISPMSTLSHSGLPIRGSNIHSVAVNPVRPPVNLTSNNFLMRNFVHTAPALTQLNQVAYQRGVDPRQLQSKATQQFVQPHNLHSLTMSSLLMGVGNNTARASVPLNSRPIQGPNQSVNALLGKSDPMACLNAASANNIQSQALNNFLKSVNVTRSGNNFGANTSNATAEFGNMTGRESPSSNFDKWFGSDLRQKMPNLPPVPTQKAQYVEEVEQRQQHTTTVQN